MRNDIAPQIPRRRIAVQKYDRVAGAGVRVRNPGAELARVFFADADPPAEICVSLMEESPLFRRRDPTDTTPPAPTQAPRRVCPRERAPGAESRQLRTIGNREDRRWQRIENESSGDGVTRTRGRIPSSKSTWPSGWPSDSGLRPLELTPPPKESELNLRAPRVKPPAALEAICSTASTNAQATPTARVRAISGGRSGATIPIRSTWSRFRATRRN